MARNFSVFINPYAGLAESVRTSAILDTRDAFDLSVSWATTSGVTAAVRYEISNDDVTSHSDPAEASWSEWTTFGVASSGRSVFFPPLGMRFARFVRGVSGASFDVDVNKLVR